MQPHGCPKASQHHGHSTPSSADILSFSRRVMVTLLGLLSKTAPIMENHLRAGFSFFFFLFFYSLLVTTHRHSSALAGCPLMSFPHTIGSWAASRLCLCAHTAQPSPCLSLFSWSECVFALLHLDSWEGKHLMLGSHLKEMTFPAEYAVSPPCM